MRHDAYPTRIGNEAILPRGEKVFGTAGYKENGFLVARNLVGKKTLKGLKEFAENNYSDPQYPTSKEPNGGAVRSLLGFHQDANISLFLENYGLSELATEFLNSEVYIHQSRINYKKGMESNGWKWHSDFETWHYQDGMPKMQCLTMMIAIDENTPFNGPLMVIPKSHKFFYSCAKPETQSSAEENFADQKEGIPSAEAIEHAMSVGGIEALLLQPGDMAIFDCNLLHVSNPNVTPYGRTNMFFVFNSVDNRLEVPYSNQEPRPIEMGAR